MVRFLILLPLVGLMFSCSDSKDCECTRTDVTNGDQQQSKVDVYDYDGSCSEMNEKNVECKEI
ncbi:MAG: hypothetical protein J6Y37_18255 [Paludibacteraceae bacterium]|nr:hypothetical protein [Paludibacteraceae bacterium]